MSEGWVELMGWERGGWWAGRLVGGAWPSLTFKKLNFLRASNNILFLVLPDAADGNQTLLGLVCDAVCGRGLISADHHGRTPGVQGGGSQSPRAAVQVLATHQSGGRHPNGLQSHADVLNANVPVSPEITPSPELSLH